MSIANSADKSLKATHGKCSNHREEVLASTTCGCFHCLGMFNPERVQSWTDNGATALCPDCGIDSVLPDASVPDMSGELLDAMEQYWFADASQ